MPEVQFRLMKATVLSVLFFGALGPVFRSDRISDVAGVIAVILPTGLAAKARIWKTVAR